MAQEEPKSINFRYNRPPNTQVVRAEGVWGGPTARANILMAFFSEHHQIPTDEEYAITSEGRLGEKLSKGPVVTVRHIGVEVVMDLAQAKAFSLWLIDKIEVLEGRLNKSPDVDDPQGSANA